MLMYRVDFSQSSPVPVECPKQCWPNSDADGFRIHDNTHFADIDKAWAKLQAEVDAGVSLSCASVNDLRKQLAAAEKQLVDATLHAEVVRDAKKDADRSKP